MALSAESLERLQHELRAGRVVFFIGAGMSIDSERNTAARLIVRLLIRLRAFGLVARRHPQHGEIGRLASALSEDFNAIFPLPAINFKKWTGPVKLTAAGKRPRAAQRAWDFILARLVGEMSKSYYECNDWICSAFTRMLEAFARVGDPADDEDQVRESLLVAMQDIEESLRRRWPCWETVPLTRIDRNLIKRSGSRGDFSESTVGKALFLDTMGFRNCPQIMGGDPEERDMRVLALSYRNKLYPRHWIWARFAREGWAPLVLTTNFDRLIEGAFRLSGFRPGKDSKDAEKLPLPIASWSTIACPEDFFDQGGRGRSALVVKIHGCAKKYEELSKPPESAEDYLKSLVFTYREIQNWRDDSWSRDFFRSLLRTRSMVFCGYSGRDAVIHDTLRSVYEEMARTRRTPAKSGTDPAAIPRSAPTYFFTSASSRGGRDFHGVEVLRSASAAATGISPPRDAPHPNYIPYRFLGSGSPSPDDLMMWLNHLAYRHSQLACLDRELRQVASSIGSPVSDLQISRIIRAFKEQVALEEKLAHPNAGDESGSGSLLIGQAIRWTYRFHPQLLKEFALATASVRDRGPGPWFREMRALPDYYFPTTAQPAWTAWGVVVELALRQAVKALGWSSCECAVSEQPTVNLFSKASRPPRALLIRHSSVEKTSAPKMPRGGASGITVWELAASSLPWLGERKENGNTKPERPYYRHRTSVPPAHLVFEWAWNENTVRNTFLQWVDPSQTPALLP